MSEREKKERKIKHAIEIPWKKRERTSIQKIGVKYVRKGIRENRR